MSTVIEEVAHEMVVLDETGDTKIVWSEDKQDEVDMAKETFVKMKKKGYVAYSVDRRGEKGQVLDEFDPSAEKIIMAPQLQGG